MRGPQVRPAPPHGGPGRRDATAAVVLPPAADALGGTSALAVLDRVRDHLPHVDE
ncbi:MULTISPECIES: hypothetical protein [unclassified Streptomyces]|uniref:hypothetical protein n=1 Tax=unclassified Streptomyces TaxID=2593676 RepID=UPI002476B9F3|nr:MULTISPECIES: hypothetical protein [unclassified Streptomyces]MDH6448353.1 hypothetical protein [Streptomyces sp. SAI-119]MDH6501065.1 hypothetical protein [Streptomyces sp. SAI-149]